MINWILNRIEKHKSNRRHIQLEKNIRDPNLFPTEVRNHLKMCFPEQWTHTSNITQLEMFKIAISLELVGIKCSNTEEFMFCIKVLTIQQICQIHPTNNLLIKRA